MEDYVKPKTLTPYELMDSDNKEFSKNYSQWNNWSNWGNGPMDPGGQVVIEGSEPTKGIEKTLE